MTTWRATPEPTFPLSSSSPEKETIYAAIADYIADERGIDESVPRDGHPNSPIDVEMARSLNFLGVPPGIIAALTQSQAESIQTKQELPLQQHTTNLILDTVSRR